MKSLPPIGSEVAAPATAGAAPALPPLGAEVDAPAAAPGLQTVPSHRTVPPEPVAPPRLAIGDQPPAPAPAGLEDSFTPAPAPLEHRALGDQPAQPAPAGLEEGAQRPDVQRMGEILSWLGKNGTMEPGQAMEVARIAAASGHPAEYVSQNIDELRKAWPAAETDWMGIAREHPDLANWILADPTRFALVRDDSANLTSTADQIIGRFSIENMGAPGTPAMLRPRWQRPPWMAVFADELTKQELIARETADRVSKPSEETLVGQRVLSALALAHERGIDARNPDEDWAPIWRQVGIEKTPEGEFRLAPDAPPPEPSEWQKANAAKIEELKKETAPRYYGPFAQSLPGRVVLAPFRLAPALLGGIASTAAGGAVGGPAGAIAGGVGWWTYQSYAPLAEQLEQVQGPDGKKLSPDEASRLAMAFSLTGSVFMEAGVAPLTSHLAPEVWARAMGGGAARALATPGTIARVGKALSALPKDVVAGAAGSAAQEAANATAVELAKAGVDPTYKPDVKEVAARTGEAFVASLADMLVLGAVAAGRTFLSDRGARIAAADSADRIRALTAQAAESKWLKNMPPEEAKKAVAAMKRSGGADPEAVVDNLYASLPEFQRYWQEQKVDPREAAAEIGPETLKAYDAAVAEKGSHVAIPAEEYLAKLATAQNGQHAKGLAEDLTLNPEVNTPRQERAEHALRQARVRELAALPPEKMEEDQRRVFDEFRRQATEAGEADDVAVSNAAWYSAGLKVLAERAGRGETAWDLWQVHPLNIEGPHTAKNRERAHYTQALEDWDAHPAGRAWSFLKSGQAAAGLEGLSERLREQAVAAGEGAVPKDLAAKIEKTQDRLASLEGGAVSEAELAQRVARGEISEKKAAEWKKYAQENPDLARQKSPLRTERLVAEPDHETGAQSLRAPKEGEQGTRPLRVPAWLKTEDFLADRQAWEWTWSATGLDAPEHLQKLVLGYMRKAFEGLEPDETAIQQGWAVARLAAGKGGRKFEGLREKLRDWMRQPEGSRAEDPIPERAWPQLLSATRADKEYVSAGKYVNRKKVEVFKKWAKTTAAEVSEERPTYATRPPAWFAEGEGAPVSSKVLERATALRKELADLNEQARKARAEGARVKPKLDLDETARILGNDAKLVPTEKGGISPDELAKAVGAPSGDALLRDMVERRERATWAKQEAGRRIAAGAAPREPARPPLPAASRALSERWHRMTPEERAREFYVDRNTGLLNDRAFFDLPADSARPMVGHISVEGTKWLNDGGEGGHEAGDLLYRMAARALHAIDPEAAKVGGDFAVRVKDQAQLDAIVARLNETMPVKGFTATGVAGESFKAAHDAHVALKTRLEAEGARAPRGERPQGVAMPKPADVVLPSERAAAELPASLREGHGRLTPRQAFERAYIEPETGILTATGWNGIPRKAHLASIDLDGLKAINELLGTKGGDAVLAYFGELAREYGGLDFDLAHLHGDEYAAQSNDAAALQGFLDTLALVSDNVRAEVEAADGSIQEVQGIGFSRGVGRTNGEAERALAAHKSERAAAGQRGDAVNARRLRLVTEGAARSPEDVARWRDALAARRGADARGASRQAYAGPGSTPEGIAAGRLEQPAFHGTGARGIDRFSTEFVGSGQGAQSYGWGLYFAENQRVAEQYRNELARGEQLTLDGTALGAGDDHLIKAANPSLSAAKIRAWKFLLETMGGLKERKGAVTSDQVLAAARTELLTRIDANERNRAQHGDFGRGQISDRISEDRKTLEAMDELYADHKVGVKGDSGQVYRVDLPDHEILLDWDLPVAKQPEKVRAALLADPVVKEAWQYNPIGDRPGKLADATGDQIYRSLVREFREREQEGEAIPGETAPEAASKHLDSLGIPGLRYLDGGSRGPRNTIWRLKYAFGPEMPGSPTAWSWDDHPTEESARRRAADLEAGIPGSGKARTELERIEPPPQTRNFVVWDDQRVQIMDRLYQRRLAGEVGGKDAFFRIEQPPGKKGKKDAGPRGVVEFPNLEPEKAAPFYIRLLDSDRSTLAHETFHAFSLIMGQLAGRGDAPAELRADYERLAKVMGYESAADRSAKRVEAKEEKGSHLWEMYLAEGQAPSRELLPVFSRFRAWLRRLYQGAQGVAAQYEARYGEKLALSDDAREIFGRLLAGDDAVRDASKEFEVEQPKVAFTPEEQAQSDRLWAEARAGAEAELQRQLVEEERKADRAFVREARAKIGEEVGAELDRSEPVYGALAALSKGEVAGMEVRLDRAAVEALVGRDVADRLPKEVFGEKDGVPPDAIAKALHFPSGSDLVLALANAEPKEARVKREVSRVMADRFPSLQDRPRAMYEAAKGGMVGDAFLRDGIMRLRAIAREAGVRPNLTDAKALKAATDEIALDKSYSGLRPDRFDVAARKYARLAAESKDPQKRLDAYESYLWNRALYRSALEARERAEKAAAYLVPFTRPKGRAKLGKATEVEQETLPDGTIVNKTTQPYLDKVDEILGAFEFKASASKKEVLSRAALEEWVRERWQDGDSVVIPPSTLAALERQTHWKDLTIREIEDLRDAVKSIAGQADLRTKFIVGGEKIATDRVIGELADAAIKNGAKVKLHLQDEVKTRGEKVAEAGRQVKHALERPEVLIDELDGYDPNGPWHRYYWNPLSDAAYHYADLVRGAQEEVQRMLRELPAADRERLRSTIEVEGQEYTMEAAVAVGLNAGNESNESKITRGMSDPRLLDLFGIQPWQGKQTVDAFLSHLTRKDVELINAIHRALESYWEASEALEKRDSGIAPVKVPTRPRRFVGADGEMLQIDGGYYPVIYSRKYRVGKRQMENDAASVNGLPGLFDPAYERALTPQGHLQTRIDNFARAFDLTLDGLPRKLTMTAKDIAFRLTAKQLYRVLTDERMNGALTQALGDKGHELLLQHLRDSVNDVMLPDPGAGIFRRVVEKLRGLAFRSTFALNVPQTLQNLADPTGISVVMPHRYFLDAALRLVKDPEGLKAWILEHSGEMRLRDDGMKTLGRDLQSVFRKSEIGLMWDRAGELMLAPFEATQQATEYPTWLGSFTHATEAKEKGGLGLSDEEAIRHANAAVRTMFGGRRTVDLTPMQRDKVLRHFTMFWGWSAAQLNQFIRASGLSRRQWTEGMVLKAMGTLGRTYAALAAKEVASSLLVGNAPEDKNENGKVDAGDLARWLAYRALMTLPTRLPMVGSAISSLEGGPVRDVSLTPWTNMLSAGFRTLSKTAQVVSDATEGTADQDEEVDLFLSWLEAGGQFVGGPSGQIRRTAGYLMDRPADAALGEDVLGTMFGPSRPGKLSTAIYGR